MKASVQISRGIESLFGTRDENIRLIENGLNVRTRLLNDSLEIEGDENNFVERTIHITQIPAEEAKKVRAEIIAAIPEKRGRVT